MKLSIGYITGRYFPRLDWFFDSLALQIQSDDDLEVIVVDALYDSRPEEFRRAFSPCTVRYVPAKPTVWQGKHRLTKEDWWALSSARNTFVAHARHDWLATLDDRMVLLPGWLEAIRRANAGNYAVAGTYSKVFDLKVEKGVMISHGKVIGSDHRLGRVGKDGIHPCGFDWYFGGSFSEATEWALKGNGHPEEADGIALNDVLYGLMLAKNGAHLKFDTSMAIIEDRVPSESGPYYRREDKGKSPHDKSHALLDRFNGKTRATQPFGELRALRESILTGGQFPIVTEPQKDWYDGQALKDM